MTLQILDRNSSHYSQMKSSEKPQSQFSLLGQRTGSKCHKDSTFFQILNVFYSVWITSINHIYAMVK